MVKVSGGVTLFISTYGIHGSYKSPLSRDANFRTIFGLLAIFHTVLASKHANIFCLL